MRAIVAAVTVAVVATGCGPSSDQILGERLDAVAAGGCEAVEWNAISEATSSLPHGDRPNTLAAQEHEAACGFGVQARQQADEEQISERSPVVVVVVARRGSADPAAVESDLMAHAAGRWVSGSGQAATTRPRLYPGHALVVAVKEEHVSELHPERLLQAAMRDLGIPE